MARRAPGRQGRGSFRVLWGVGVLGLGVLGFGVLGLGLRGSGFKGFAVWV